MARQAIEQAALPSCLEAMDSAIEEYAGTTHGHHLKIARQALENPTPAFWDLCEAENPTYPVAMFVALKSTISFCDQSCGTLQAMRI